MATRQEFAGTLDRVAAQFDRRNISPNVSKRDVDRSMSGRGNLLRTNINIRDAQESSFYSKEMLAVLEKLEALTEEGISTDAKGSKELLKRLDVIENFSKTVLINDKERDRFAKISGSIRKDLRSNSSLVTRGIESFHGALPGLAASVTGSLLGHSAIGGFIGTGLQKGLGMLIGHKSDDRKNLEAQLISYVQKMHGEISDEKSFVERVASDELPKMGKELRNIRQILETTEQNSVKSFPVVGPTSDLSQGDPSKKKKGFLDKMLGLLPEIFTGDLLAHMTESLFGWIPGLLKKGIMLLLPMLGRGLMIVLKKFPIIALVTSMVHGLYKMFSDWFHGKGFLNGLMDFVNTVADDLIRAFTLGFLNLDKVNKWIGDHMGPFFDWLFGDIFAPIGKFFSWAIDSFATAFKTEWGWVKKGFGWLMDDIITPIGKFFGAILGADAKMLTWAWGWVQKGLSWLGGIFSVVGKGFKKLLKDLSWKNIKSEIGDLMHALLGGLKDFFGTAVTGLLSAFGVPSAIITKILQSLGLSGPVGNPGGAPVNFYNPFTNKTTVGTGATGDYAQPEKYAHNAPEARSGNPQKVLSKENMEYLQQTEKMFGFKPGTLLSQIQHESGFRPNINGATNANGTYDMGLVQVNTKTLPEVEAYAKSHNIKGSAKDGSLNPYNVSDALAIQRIVYLLKGKKGHDALVRYNGSGVMAQNYANSIEADSSQFAALDDPNKYLSSSALAANQANLDNQKDARTAKSSTTPASAPKIVSNNVQTNNNTTVGSLLAPRQPLPWENPMFGMAI